MARSSVSDERLIRRVAEGDKEAAYTLLLRHTGIVGWAVRERVASGAGVQGLPVLDAEQAGLLGLWRAIQTYRVDSTDTSGATRAQFSTYAKTVVRNAIEDACRSATAQREQALNTSVSIDADHSSARGAAESVPGGDVERQALNELEFRADLNALRSVLTPQEYQVLRGHLAGLTYQEVGASVGSSYKAVDGAMQRIRRKARELGAAQS